MNAPATNTPAPARAGRREWLGLVALALPTLLVSIDIGVLYLALPSVSRALDADGVQQLWIIDIYSFLIAGFLVTMGNLGDRIGRRRLLLIGAALFGIASVLAAFAPTAELLIAARALLGIAAATISLIRNMFTDPKQMGTAFGVWFACFMGGILLGPLVGGLLLEHFWWGSVFLLGLPVMVLVLIFAPILLPEYKAANPGRIDLPSVALSLAAILPAIWGIKELARSGPGILPIVTIVVGLALSVVFVRRQLRLADPLLDLRLFANRVFSTSLVMMVLGGVIMAAISLVSATYLQLVIGLSPLQAGLWLIPQNVVMIIGFQVAPLLARKIPVSIVIALGLVLGALGFAVQAFITPTTPVVLVAIGLSLAAFGMAFPMALLTTLLMAATPPDKAGAAAAVNETAGEFGIAVGIATLGTLATLVFRLQLGGEFDSLAAALTVAVDRGGEAGAALADAARAAYSAGYATVASIGVAIFLAMAIVALAVLRRRTAPVPAEELVSA